MSKFRFSIDRGGTFTDVYAWIPTQYRSATGGSDHLVMKLLSEDPGSYPDAPREAIRRILERCTGRAIPASVPVPTADIESIRMGTTVATNALLERKGERTAFATTKGFRDLLHIGNQSRPRIFDLEINRPDLLYDSVIEIDERIQILCDTASSGQDSEGVREANAALAQSIASEGEFDVVKGNTGEYCVIRKKPDEEAVKAQLQKELDQGITSLAVSLVHSYAYPAHEQLVGRLARSLGFRQVTLSSSVMAMVKLVPRSFTACADAYLTPCIQVYLTQFVSGFDSDFLSNVKLLFMQSDGGLAPIQDFCGFRAVLSGPAGGAVGYTKTTPIRVARSASHFMDLHSTIPLQPALLGFDMGGTSTDVSRYSGRFEHVFENTTAGVTIQAPQLDINTVAAGGGSILTYRNRMFNVGPESAGANPGPACYRKQGPLTITDANLVLGRIMPEFFPPIFGPNRDEPLDVAAPLQLFKDLTETINAAEGRNLSIQDVALGFVEVANEAMCRPIRALTQARGYDLTSHTLACFGGAGGQHCCAIARKLGLGSVFIHRFSGILSAFGMGVADIVKDVQTPLSQYLSDANWSEVTRRVNDLSVQARNEMRNQGFKDADITLEVFLNLRYHGTDTAVMTNLSHSNGDEDDGFGVSASSVPVDAQKPSQYKELFMKNYQREYGFTLDRDIIVDDVRVRAIGHSEQFHSDSLPRRSDSDGPLKPIKTVQACFEGTNRAGAALATAVYLMESLKPGDYCDGPAIILDKTSTILVEPGCTAHCTQDANIAIRIPRATAAEDMKAVESASSEECDAVQLSVFSHRFSSIAEQMGRTLQRTSISTNIKERLDFSCALFDEKGGLVANAPHLPVHLGAMQEAVRFQIGHLGSNWHPGDVVLSNHPQAGGSHLPDITVITPVFDTTQSPPVPVFFVASRGHHADIGGITPGSMPPHSRSLIEEGAAIMSFKLVEAGNFNEPGITQLLKQPAAVPRAAHEAPISGTRNLRDNLSDLKAQVAANHKGIQLVTELINQYSLPVVQAYMRHIQGNAELAVREMLKELAASRGLKEVDTLVAEEFMDDGSKIRLALTIDSRDGSAIFDFSGTSPEVYANFNAPRAITYSAIIYCLRCLVKRDIPLNQGCLNGVRVIVPDGCFLNPSPEAAVVGGNVLTSQRLCDVVLKCFAACAGSQGCMNNLTFGNANFGYYETIAGGAGAGPNWHGQSGVHTHMTNCFPEDHQVFTRLGFMYLNQIESQLANSGTIDIACFVQGRLEYHAINSSQLIVKDSVQPIDHILFETNPQKSLADSLNQPAISLLPTANHRMWAAVQESADRNSLASLGCVECHGDRYAIHAAGDLYNVGQRDAASVAHFHTRFPFGYQTSQSKSPSALPFASLLGLQTDDELNAFLEFYGYFLVAGCLDPFSRYVSLEATNSAAVQYLDRLLERLDRVLPVNEAVCDGYQIDHSALWSFLAQQDNDDRQSAPSTPRQVAQPFAEPSTPSASSSGSRCSLSQFIDATQNPNQFSSWVWTALDSSQKRLIIDGLQAASSEECGMIGVSSIQMRDDIVRLGIEAGYSMLFSQAEESESNSSTNKWIVSYSDSSIVSTPSLQLSVHSQLVRRSGKVWCVSVPTADQLIMVRRVINSDHSGAIISASRPVVVGNTRITDPEILERRYPVMLREFSLRRGSGGRGRFKGGEGIIREIQFMQPVSVNILSERRITEPYGLEGGEPGARGLNLIIRADGRILNLGGKNTYHAQSGDRIRIETPGGGGFGAPEDETNSPRKRKLTGSSNSADQPKRPILAAEHGSLADWKARQEQV